jgi:hypothetical protein
MNLGVHHGRRGRGYTSGVIAIGSLLVVMALSLVITRVATVLLVATGMSRQAARFQARSAFTGSGFTTRESEEVVNHPLRRRVVMTLMLLGNAGIVAVASSLIIGFRSGGHTQWISILELVVGMAALLVVSRSSWVDQRLTQAIRHLLERHTDLPTRDLASLLDLTGHYAVGELHLEEGDWLVGQPLGDLALRDEGIAVLGVTRADGSHLGVPGGWTVLAPGDTAVIYGRADSLDEIDRRPAGPEGDRRHEIAVEHQRLLVLAERSADLAREGNAPAVK